MSVERTSTGAELERLSLDTDCRATGVVCLGGSRGLSRIRVRPLATWGPGTIQGCLVRQLRPSLLIQFSIRIRCASFMLRTVPPQMCHLLAASCVGGSQAPGRVRCRSRRTLQQRTLECVHHLWAGGCEPCSVNSLSPGRVGSIAIEFRGPNRPGEAREQSLLRFGFWDAVRRRRDGVHSSFHRRV